MKVSIAAVAALALSTTGCFTTWVGVRAAGYPGAADENVREERVPLPGIDEKLVVSLAMPNVTPSGVSFDCKANQHGRDAVYRAAYRYGSRWKKTTALMFVAEAALGSVLLLATDRDDPNRVLQLAGGAFLAADAVGTGVLFFAPRKELYARSEIAVTTPVRSVCPEGVMVELGGDSFPLDAAGSLGDLGTAALDEWMQQPTRSFVITFAGRSTPLAITDGDRCFYQRARSAGATMQTQIAGATAPTVAPLCTAPPRVLAAVIDVPAGTLAAM